MGLALRQYRPYICALLLAAAPLCGCVAAVGAPTKPPTQAEKNRLANTLKQETDWYERAFGYHQNCLKDTEPMSPVFLANYEETANLLFDELLKTHKWEPERTVNEIVKRREQIQSALQDYYQVNGCQSSEAAIARDRYRTLSQTNES